MLKPLSSLFETTGNLINEIFGFISAPVCPACGAELDDLNKPLCTVCDFNLLYAGDGPVCLICRSPKGVPCGCRKQQQMPIPQLYYWAPYDEVIRALIHQFKFERQMKLGGYLTEKALGHLSDRLDEYRYDIIIPIPMTKNDKRKRSFNQTELIANAISEKINTPVNPGLLTKDKPTKLQANLGREERWRNIQSAFRVADFAAIDGKSILLVDDIVTTGATSLEAAKALYQAKAGEITVFALASSHHED